MAEERQEELNNTQGINTMSTIDIQKKKNISSVAVPGVKLKTFKSGVGKYINPSALQKTK